MKSHLDLDRMTQEELQAYHERMQNIMPDCYFLHMFKDGPATVAICRFKPHESPCCDCCDCGHYISKKEAWDIIMEYINKKKDSKG